jgi:phosphate transport system substrate-binding protein
VEIDQHAPSISLVENNVYQFWAIEHMYTKGNPDSLSSSFITYVINNIKTNETFIRLQDMSPTILAMHT